jgi:branched-chain amino acid transport system substrate-binding protein
MSMKRGWWGRGALLAGATVLTVAALAAGATASTDTRGAAAASTVRVGLIYSRTGALSGFGNEYVAGFEYGLVYAKKTMSNCGGHKIDVTYVDDQTNPTNAATAAKDLIGQGVKIIAGSTSSGAALQVAPIADQNNVLFISGAAASDAITGLNRHTFRSGRQSYQDVMTAANFLPPKSVGKKIVVFAEDTAFGASNVSAVTQVFGGKGHSVSKILVPFQTADLTPYAQQLKNAHADLVFVAWAGSNSPAMWQALQQQGVMQSTDVVTGLADRVNYAPFGPLVPGVKLLSHYVYQAPKNKVNAWLVAQMRQRSGTVPDLFTPDGFVTAMMICHAVQKTGGADVDRMISALEGWQFLAPKGIERIRKSDHAMIQPMFEVQLVKQKNGNYEPKVLKTISPGNVQPPVHPFSS